ncbi:MAG: hypothetical protein AAF551_09305 [Bacteroidota bacterium]
MATIKKQQNQSLLDLSLQYYGTIERVFELMDDNSLTEITGEVSVYTDLNISREPEQRDIVAFYQNRSLAPATDTNPDELLLLKTHTSDSSTSTT